MKDIISYETSLALKEAGFPQPEPEPGQMWYTPKGTACFCVKVVPGWITLAFPGDWDTYEARPGRLTYAPSATEIISLGGMTMASLTWINASDGMDWQVSSDGCECYDKSPAEAAAAAWLEKNKQ